METKHKVGRLRGCEIVDKIQKALTKAYEIHASQKRKGGTFPYFVHILDVCKYLMYETSDEDVICAGLLHDAFEDTDYTRDELRADFGERVYALVDFCTEPGNTKNHSAPWKERKQHSIERLADGSYEELLVFVADKLANVLSMQEDLVCGESLWERFNASKEDIEWYYESILREVKPKLGETRLYNLFKHRIGEVFGVDD